MTTAFCTPLILLNLNFMAEAPKHWPVPVAVYALVCVWFFCQLWLWLPLGLLGRTLLQKHGGLAAYPQRFPLYAAIACAIFEVIMPQFFPSPWPVSWVEFAPYLKPVSIFSGTLYTFTTFWCAHHLANAGKNSAAATLTIILYLLSFAYFSVNFPLRSDETNANSSTFRLVSQDFQAMDFSHLSTTEKNAAYTELESKKQNLLRLISPSDSPPVDMVILAEGAYVYSMLPETLKIGQPFFDADFVEAARHLKSDILLGTYIAESPSGNEAGSNSALLITPNGTVNGRYDKRNLIPFFEGFSNTWLRESLGRILHLNHLFASGQQASALATSAGKNFLVLICYEMYFSDSVRDAVKRHPEARFIVNISKDLLIANSSTIDFINAQIRLRSMEAQRPVVRSASFGPSGIFNPDGSFELTKSSVNGQSTLTRLNTGVPIKSIYLQWGLFPLALLFFLLVLLENMLHKLLAKKSQHAYFSGTSC